MRFMVILLQRWLPAEFHFTQAFEGCLLM
jgi:hypothetical protein